jgi:hypothetical protein
MAMDLSDFGLTSVSKKTNSSRIFTPAVSRVLLYTVYAAVLSAASRFYDGPALVYDDGYFFLVSYSWLNGLGFNNFWSNPISSSIFNWHGFLQPMLVAYLSPCGTLNCVNIGLIAVGAIYLAVWYVVVDTVATAHALRWILYAIGVSNVLQFSARPELVASLELISIIPLYYYNTHFVPRALAAGVLVGLAIVTDPVAGVFAGLGVAAATTFVRRCDAGYIGFGLEGILCLVSALCALVVMFAFVYPYSPIDWLDGIREHMVRTAGRQDTSGFLKYYIGTKRLPLLVIMLFTLAGIFVYALKEMWQAGNRLFFSLAALLCAAFLYFIYSAIRIPALFYNFTVLVPSIALIAVILRNNIGAHQRYARFALFGSLIVFAAGCTFSQVVWVAQTISLARDHHHLTDGIASSVDRYLTANRRISMDTPLMGAIDNLEKLKRIDILDFNSPHKLNENPPLADVLFRAQAEFGVLADDVPGFKLVVNNYNPSRVTHFIKPKGPYYAIYEAIPH